MIKTKSILEIKGEGIIFDDVKVLRHDDDNEASKYDVYNSYGKHLMNGFADDVAYFLNKYYDLSPALKKARTTHRKHVDLSVAYAVGKLYEIIEETSFYLQFYQRPEDCVTAELEIKLLKSAIEKISGKPYQEKS